MTDVPSTIKVVARIYMLITILTAHSISEKQEERNKEG